MLEWFDDPSAVALPPEALEEIQQGGIVLLAVRERGRPLDTNTFDDLLGWADGEGIHMFPGTCDPGTWYASGGVEPNPAGVPFVVPGYYPGAMTLGLHRGRYRALLNRGETAIAVKRYQPGDIEGRNAADLETGPYVSEYVGINIHRASLKIRHTVDLYSAGCMVYQDPADLDEVLRACQQDGGETFSLVVLNVEDINDIDT